MAPLENLQRPTPYRILVENPQSGGLTMSPGGGGGGGLAGVGAGAWAGSWG